MVRTERTSREWFAEAERCYIERHQGCAWCRGSYRVYRVRREHRTEYSCNGCDFRAAHDEQTGQYSIIPGEKLSGRVKETMFEL
jgi:hypothetical protein